MSRTHIVSFATDLSRVEALSESARTNGFDVTVLSDSQWDGYHQKLISTKDYVSSHLHEDDLLLFVDAYDVVFTRALEDIEAEFRRFQSPLVFGAEMNCWPGYFRRSYWARSPSKPSSAHKYLNSGFYIGTKAGVLDFLCWKSSSDLVDLCKDGGDQVYAHKYFLERGFRVGVKLDHACTLVLNMHHVRWSELLIDQGRLVNMALGTRPCALHFNGGSFRDGTGKDMTSAFLDLIAESARDDSMKSIEAAPAFHKGNVPLSQLNNKSYSLLGDKLAEWRSMVAGF